MTSAQFATLLTTTRQRLEAALAEPLPTADVSATVEWLQAQDGGEEEEEAPLDEFSSHTLEESSRLGDVPAVQKRRVYPTSC